MSTKYFIFPADTNLWKVPGEPKNRPKPTLQINSRDFATALKKKFPFAIRHGETGYKLNAEKSEAGVEVYVLPVEEIYTTAYMTPYGDNLVEFILWYRNYVPDEHELYLNGFHKSFEGLELTSETTQEDIESFMNV
ncbi:MAG: hypothetical protein AAFN11_08170 [Chloroflexota bacterium]